MGRAEGTADGAMAIRTRAMISAIGIRIRRIVGLVIWNKANELRLPLDVFELLQKPVVGNIASDCYSLGYHVAVHSMHTINVQSILHLVNISSTFHRYPELHIWQHRSTDVRVVKLMPVVPVQGINRCPKIGLMTDRHLHKVALK